MAPGLTTELPIQSADSNTSPKKASYPTPLKLSGVLDKFEHEDVTPVIGREFPKVNIVDDLLRASNADELLRDVAITSEFPNPNASSPFHLLSLTLSHTRIYILVEKVVEK